MSGKACVFMLVLAFAATGCATAPPPRVEPKAETKVETKAKATDTTTVVAPDGPPLNSVTLSDPCAQFNANQSKISAEEHMRRYGCPPCPCACINGQITCAPCARCEGFQHTADPLTTEPTLTPTPADAK